MLSRKSKDKSIKGGVIGKYVKKDEPPEIPSKYSKRIFSVQNIIIVISNSYQHMDK